MMTCEKHSHPFTIEILGESMTTLTPRYRHASPRITHRAYLYARFEMT